MKSKLLAIFVIIIALLVPLCCQAQGSATNPDFVAAHAATVSLRNNYPVGLRKWGILITVYADPTPSNNKTYYLKYNNASQSLADNNNWVDAASVFGGGSGITNSAVANELMKSDGTNAVPSGLFSSALGNINLGTSSISGDRTIQAPSSSNNNKITLRANNSSGTLTDLFSVQNFLNKTYVTYPNPIEFGGDAYVLNTLYANAGMFSVNSASTTRRLESQENSAPANSVLYPFRISSVGSISFSPGFGTGMEFATQNSAAAIVVGSTIESTSTNITSGSESFDIVFKNMNSGVAAAETFRFSSFGGLKINGSYGIAGQVPISGGPSGALSWGSSGGGTTTNSLTFNNSGSGASSGTTFNGGTAQTVSYNTIGAAPATSGATTTLLYPNGSGGFSNATVGSGLGFSGGTLTNTLAPITPQTLTDGATITWNGLSGINATVTLGGTGRTLTISNPVAGQVFLISILQDGTGSRTITTWPTGTIWVGGTAPTLTTTASAKDLVSFYYDGTNYWGTYSYNYQ